MAVGLKRLTWQVCLADSFPPVKALTEMSDSINSSDNVVGVSLVWECVGRQGALVF